MSEESKSVITILEDDRPMTTVAAPPNSYAARQLWVFPVENVRPGLEVTRNHERGQLRRSSGQTVPPELYRRAMFDLEEV